MVSLQNMGTLRSNFLRVRQGQLLEVEVHSKFVLSSSAELYLPNWLLCWSSQIKVASSNPT